MDAAADAILATVQLTLLCLGQVAIVLSLILLLGFLQAGLPVFQMAGFLRTQRSVLDTIGDAILLPIFAAVHLIHAGMAGVDGSGVGRASSCGLGKSGARQDQASECHA